MINEDAKDRGVVMPVGQLSGCTGRQPAVSEALEALERAASALACEVDSMCSRLSPVLRSPEPQPCQGGICRQPYPDVAMVNIIMRIESILREREDQLRNCQSRMEI